MSNQTRIVFIVSDGTGITAENFSQSILAQFEATFKHIRIPFVDSVDKAHEAVSSINQAFNKYGVQPIVFTTLVNAELNSIVGKANGLILDMFQTFVAPLEAALGMKSTHAMNRLHHNADTEAYKNRIEAINCSFFCHSQCLCFLRSAKNVRTRIATANTIVVPHKYRDSLCDWGFIWPLLSLTIVVKSSQQYR